MTTQALIQQHQTTPAFTFTNESDEPQVRFNKLQLYFNNIKQAIHTLPHHADATPYMNCLYNIQTELNSLPPQPIPKPTPQTQHYNTLSEKNKGKEEEETGKG